MSTQDFIKHIAAGQASDAKETLNNILSTKAFEALDARKIELAKTAFNGKEYDLEETEEYEDDTKMVLEDYLNEDLSHNAHELVLHADNDSHLYKTSHVPIAKNLEKKFKKGTYDHEKAKTLWKSHADRAADSYAKEHGSPGQKGHHIFSVKDRKQAAEHFANYHHAEMQAGNFHDI